MPSHSKTAIFQNQIDPMAKITITDLELYFHVGVPDAERARPQRLLLCLEMDYDFGPAAATDDIHQTINYYDVTQQLINLGEDRSWKLIETLANDAADLILQKFPASSVAVTVKKFVLPEAAHVSVTLTKQRAAR